ncbi:MAG: WecB/TagA/CpsF family glycosyltransferase [Hyphomicrobiaceae bacterium]|nr:WecB/TagA/CpsF family glycosyltransferase [Hyphomicrobiaceae bacterium]
MPSDADIASKQVETVMILGVPVSAIDMTQALAAIGDLVATRRGGFICVADVHSVMQARTNMKHRAALEAAALVTPDGTPLSWVGRLRGFSSMARVSGPDLLPAACAASRETGWRHYFYGGAEGVADELARRLSQRFPGLVVAGTECPPFRALSQDEMQAALDRIVAAKPDIVWVGLGCPKQELWMHEHASKLAGAVSIGIGAAFDFHAGRIHRAPVWMQRNGLEWLHRLWSEPRRLWYRYLVLAPKFVTAALAEHYRLRRMRRQTVSSGRA